MDISGASARGRTLRLARYFGGDAQSWLNLQASFDLKTAEQHLRAAIKREVWPLESP
jgi:antitoxin HigA-1